MWKIPINQTGSSHVTNFLYRVPIETISSGESNLLIKRGESHISLLSADDNCMFVECTFMFFNTRESSVAFFSNNSSINVWPAIVCFCSVGYKLWGRRRERDCPVEYSASLEAVEVSKGNISAGTHLQVLPTASLLSVFFF